MPTVQASSNEPFREGYEDGKEDYLSGNSNQSYCDPYNSDPNPDAYCTWYKLGYTAGWVYAQGLYGNQ